MDGELAKLVKDENVEGVRAHLDAQSERPEIHDLLWCAALTEDADCRRLLVDVATQKKITPKKKGWAWNDALAAAIVGDPERIAAAEKRSADFELRSPFGTPLTLAIRLGHVDFVNALLDKGVDAVAPVKMARLTRKLSLFSSNLFMTDATPLGVALRLGFEDVANALLAHVKIQQAHLADAVQGSHEGLVRRVAKALEAAGELSLDPALFWSVHDPSVVPVLADLGLDLSELPKDHGTWGGPIWSWWAYDLRGGDGALESFAALFATGVRATTTGLGDVLGANRQGNASTEMVDLFLAHGADLGDEVEWESDDWDEENDCQKIERGSLAERLMREAPIALVQYIHGKGAEIRPLRANPDWRDAEDKKTWLESLGLIKGIAAADLPWLDSPSDDEIRAFLATEDGIFGLKLGMTRDDLPEGFDLERAEEGDGLYVGFDDAGCLESVSRQYYDLGSKPFLEALTTAFGEPKGRGAKRWRVPGGIVKREDHNDAGLFTNLDMHVTEN